MSRAAHVGGPADGGRPSPARTGRGGRAAGFLAVILLGALAPAAAQVPSRMLLPFVTIAAGTTSSIRTPGQFVVRTQADWLALWRRHGGPTGSAIPQVDFHRDMVVGVFAGEVRGQAAVAIVRISREPDRLVVWYSFRDTRPIPGAESSVPSAPFSIVRLLRSPLPVSFVQVKAPQVIRRP